MTPQVLNHAAFPVRPLAQKQNVTEKQDNTSFNLEYAMLQSLHAKNSFLTNILATANIGIWSMDLQTKKLSLSPVTMQLLKDSTHKPLTLTSFLHKLAISGQSGFAIAVNKACKTRAAFEEEVSLMFPDGEKWFRISGKIVTNSSTSKKIAGVITDITKDKITDIKRKDQMAFLSHELKTPLSTIKLCLQMGIKRAFKHSDLKSASMLTLADQQVENMVGMINNSLDVSLIENNKLMLQKSEFDVSELVNDLVHEMAFLNTETTFKTELSDAIFINGDRAKIKQVLTNYISNAVKFSGAKSTVYIKCKKARNGVTVTVKDSGTGISAENQKLLFMRNSRVCIDQPDAPRGHGLGLFLSKEIIERHNGRVWVKSLLGEGATFGFSLPL